MPVKQVIVVRTRYPDGKGGFFKPRTGKLIAQGAHASMKVLLDHMTHGFIERMGDAGFEFTQEDSGTPALLLRPDPAMLAWLRGSFTKVCVQVDSEEALLDVVQRAQAAGLPVALIEDSGATEFHGVKTATCCAVGPADAEAIDRITGGLRLL